MDLLSDATETKLAKSLSSLTDVPLRCTKHFIYLMHLEQLHNLACEAMDSDTKLKKFDLDIPYVGVLHLSLENNDITVDSAEFKRWYVNDVISAITTGESKLLKSLNKRFLDTLTKTYKELL